MIPVLAKPVQQWTQLLHAMSHNLCRPAAALLTVLATPTVGLTFGNNQTIGTFGPTCKMPVTASATVTGVTGFATPTGNVTLSLRAMHPGLHPAYTITVQTVRPLSFQLSSYCALQPLS